MKKSLLCACAVCLLMVTAVIPPQVYGKASVEEENTTGPGWILGPFSISPKISLAGGYDSNIYATRHDKISDRFMVLAPSIEVNSTWKTHKLKLSTGAAVNRFDKYSSEDTEDYWLDGSGRYDLDTQNNIFGGVSFSQEHEERGSPDDAAGLEPALYLSSGFHLGTEFVIHKLSFKMGGTLKSLDFDDVPTLTSSIDNDDRDRRLSGAGIRARYLLSEGFSPFCQLIYDQRRYDQRLDYAGFRRDSDGYRMALGIKSRMTTLSSEVSVGYLLQDYNDVRFKTVKAFDISATVSWNPRPGTQFRIDVERSVNETTLPDTSGYLETAGQLKLIQKLGQKLTFSGEILLSQDNYQEIKRKDHNLNAGLRFKYDLTTLLYIASDYQFYRRYSNVSPIGEVDGNDFQRYQLFVTLGLRF